MTLLESFLLSFLQGATEFLPISSSGHLVLAAQLAEERGFGSVASGAENLQFAILVHVGTLLAIGFVFRDTLLQLARYLLGEGWRRTRNEGFAAAWLADPRGRLISAVILATVPTGLIGFLGKDYFEALFSRPDRVGWALCVTAFLLALTFFRSGGRENGVPDAGPALSPGAERKANRAEPRRGAAAGARLPGYPFPLWISVAVGVAQGLAITPGVSRSGATISVALLLGMSRRAAGEFSFLIAVPAILGALLLQVLDVLEGGAAGAAGAPSAGASLSLSAGALAFVVSCLSGYVFLRLLLRFLRGGQFSYFSVYCLAVGLWAIWRF